MLDWEDFFRSMQKDIRVNIKPCPFCGRAARTQWHVDKIANTVTQKIKCTNNAHEFIDVECSSVIDVSPNGVSNVPLVVGYVDRIIRAWNIRRV